MDDILYPKINTLFKRDSKGKIIEDEFSLKEFEYLKNNLWSVTEKVDGTNIRVIWNSDLKTVTIKGKANNSTMNDLLYSKLLSIFTVERMDSYYPNTSMILFGEGYGFKVQKCGKRYLVDDHDFILFDVNINGKWLNTDNITDIANTLKIKRVPLLTPMTILQVIELIKNGGFISTISNDNTLVAEGVVIKPLCAELYSYDGKPIIAKLKVQDYKE